MVVLLLRLFGETPFPGEDQGVVLHLDTDLLLVCDELTDWGWQPTDSRPSLERFFKCENPTAEFIKELAEYEVDTSDVDEVIRVRYMDLDPEYIKQMQKALEGR